MGGLDCSLLGAIAMHYAHWVMLKYAGDASDACGAALGEAGEATGKSKERTIDGNYATDRRGGQQIHASDMCTREAGEARIHISKHHESSVPVPVVMQRVKCVLCSVVTQNEFVRAVTFSAEHAPVEGLATSPDETVLAKCGHFIGKLN